MFYDGMVHVCERMCDSCIFRPGNLMDLHPGRVAGMVKDAKRKDGAITCHETLDHKRGAVCRGYFDRHRGATLQIAERLGFIEWFKV